MATEIVPPELRDQQVHKFDERTVGQYVADMIDQGRCPGFEGYRRRTVGGRGDRRHWRTCDNPLSAAARKRGDVRCGQCVRDDIKARATEARDASQHAETLDKIREPILALREAMGETPSSGFSQDVAGLIGELRELEPRDVSWNVKLEALVGIIEL